MVPQDHDAEIEARPRALTARKPDGDDVAAQFLLNLSGGFVISSVRDQAVPTVIMGAAVPSADGSSARPGPVVVVHDTCFVSLLVKQKYAVNVALVSVRGKLKRVDIDFGDLALSYPAEGVATGIANLVGAKVAAFKLFAFEKLHRRFGGTGVVQDAA